MSIVGISPSDIVLFVKFTATVIDALREGGGVKQEYQNAIQSCENLQLILQRLGEIHASIPDGHSNYTDQVSNIVSLFRAKLGAYESSLGSNATKSLFRNGRKKLAWALSTAKDLDKFRKSIATDVDNITLLMLQKNSDESSALRTRGEQIQVSIEEAGRVSGERASTTNRKIDDQTSTILDAVQSAASETAVKLQDFHSAQAQILEEQRNQIAELSREIRDNVEASREQSLATLDHSVGSSEPRTNSTQSSSSSTRSELSIVDSAYFSDDVVGNHLANPGNANNNIHVSNSVSFLQDERQECQPESHQEWTKALKEAFRHIGLAFRLLMRKLNPNFAPYLTCIQNVAEILLPVPRLLPVRLEDVRFEDALGDAQNVPFELCRDVEIFEAWVRVLFQKYNKPGLRKVLRREYHLLKGSTASLPISDTEWVACMRPGASIFMSMIVQSPLASCAKCMGNLKRTDPEFRLQCNTCSQPYMIEHQSTDEARGSQVQLPESLPNGISTPGNISVATQSNHMFINDGIAFFKTIHLMIDQHWLRDLVALTTAPTANVRINISAEDSGREVLEPDLPKPRIESELHDLSMTKPRYNFIVGHRRRMKLR
ncbi:MAG: hypothetical protein M1820_004309 [Bogoriella megaspora]|nr:MAG: hypothetical protein M1820_004309 [Bogoriella megaspora]